MFWKKALVIYISGFSHMGRTSTHCIVSARVKTAAKDTPTKFWGLIPRNSCCILGLLTTLSECICNRTKGGGLIPPPFVHIYFTYLLFFCSIRSTEIAARLIIITEVHNRILKLSPVAGTSVFALILKVPSVSPSV